MLIETLSQRFRKARYTNATDNGFPSRVPVNAQPSGRGDAAAQTTRAVFDLRSAGEFIQNSALVCPYAVASDNGTFSVRAIGWRVVIDPNPSAVTPSIDTAVWVPVLLCEVLCTVSAAVPGVTGGTVGTTELFADTIALVGTSGNVNVSMEIVSPANDASAAHFVVDIKGFELFELTFTTGGSATSCNALFAMM